MADEGNRWLDGAAAERLLRGEPVGPVADHRARAEAARLRGALHALTPPTPPPGGPELPGEAAAVAAFRAAHGTPARKAGAPAAGPLSADEPVVELSPVCTAAAPRRGATVRFGLAAAFATVAIGGVAAAAAGAGLFDRAQHTNAGPAPAVSVSAGVTADSAGGMTAAPQPTPGPRRDPLREDLATASSGPVQSPAPDGRGAFTDPQTPGAGGSGDGGKSRDGDGDGETGMDAGSAAGTKDRETRHRAMDLCQDFRAGRLSDDRRERLTRLARGTQRVARFCDTLLDGGKGGAGGGSGSGSGTGGGGDVAEAPTALPSASAGGGSLDFRNRR
ncbi:hypothetical protein [Streptomyces sp. NPDC090022]|uniref:hypothetical protein n=1 Tax=Streptomyces sp. NPDC090022 TaxID=3365920 RepID=UPI00382C2442